MQDILYFLGTGQGIISVVVVLAIITFLIKTGFWTKLTNFILVFFGKTPSNGNGYNHQQQDSEIVKHLLGIKSDLGELKGEFKSHMQKDEQYFTSHKEKLFRHDDEIREHEGRINAIEERHRFKREFKTQGI